MLGATNAFTKERGIGRNQLTGETQPFSKIARDYQKKNHGWVIIGEDNYGEGSSREHAAMSPRFLGAKAVIVKSFARIHETNLKKQGVLPLVFENPKDMEKIQEKDRIHILGLKNLKYQSRHPVVLYHDNGAQEEIVVTHSMNEDQIKWFKAGSALNLIRR